MTNHDNPGTFRGQLQRGRGSAVRRALLEPGTADAVYECVTNDPRWDRQVEERDGYLAGLIRQLDLPLGPIERHLVASDDEDAEGIELALQVLAVLPFAGRLDAAAVLRRYALEGKHWAAALDAIDCAGTLELPGLWDGLADDVVASHGERRIRDVACYGSQLWAAWAHSHSGIRRILEQDENSHRLGQTPGADRQQQRRKIAESATENLIRRLAAGDLGRRLVLEELGRRGELLVLDLAEDPGMRNAAGWMPGMPQALRHLGPAALPRARAWITGDATVSELGVWVLAEHGDVSDIPALLAALRRAVSDGSWCAAEIPARGLGRLRAGDAAGDLASAWESTPHSTARAALLEGLHGCAPDSAGSFAVEGLYDCEPSVQQLACATAANNSLLRSRLDELAEDPLTPEVHEAARARRAALRGEGI